MPVTRRDFLGALAVGQAVPPAGKNPPQLCIFSKHLPDLNYEQLGKTTRELGFHGVDLTVRAKGHVLPERAAEDLPRAVETLRSHGMAVPMITTELLSAAHPTARPIISTAGRLKIPYLKPGYYRWGASEPEQRLAEVRRDLQGLMELGKEFGVQIGFHNHSGDNVGMAIWDTREMIRDLDPRWVGYYFDPCHSVVEGGLTGWQVALKLVAPRLKMVAIKDFYWAKQDSRWRVRWCPLGEGMVEWPRVFAAFAAARFTGPMSLHVEYNPSDELAAIAQDLAFIKQQVRAAYGA
jgi:sugar phosphate isomerase/epimerase